MRDKAKKIISLVAAATLLGSTLALSACGGKNYSLDKPLTMPEAGEAVENGGFVVEKGGYAYFINGAENYDADNTFGNVVKGALMRIDTDDLAAGNYDKVETVVPMLFTAQNFDAGIYIYGDYVYYGTTPVDEDLYGNALTSSLDFKRAKLDGSETMKEEYFRVSSNSLEYRFVEIDDVVYCLYNDGGTLKSFNTDTRVTTTLVAGTDIKYYFDETDAENGTVYYTMPVKKNVDKASASDEAYNQLYRVSADATVSVDKDAVSYTVTGKGYTKTYNFAGLKDLNKEAKDEGKEEPYDLSDYTTYPYVNAGELVLDGISKAGEVQVTQFSNAADYEAAAPQEFGYKYTVQSNENGGVYFTRAKVLAGDENEVAELYFLDGDDVSGTWNTISANENLTVVSKDTANATAAAVFYISGGKHYYLYVANSNLYRATLVEKTLTDAGNTPYTALVDEAVEIVATGMGSSENLLFVKDNYLYYTDGSNHLFRVDYTGEEEDYSPLNVDLETSEYVPVQILEIEYDTSWYAPKFVGNTLLFGTAQTTNSTNYKYVYGVNLAGANGMMNVQELKAFNEKYTKVTDYIEEIEDDETESAIRYYFRTGKTDLYEAVKDLYETEEKNEIDAFVGHTVSANKSANDYTEKFKDGDKFYDVESYFYKLLGAVNEADKEAMKAGWETALRHETVEEEKEEFPVWAIILIVVGSVLVAGGVAFIVVWQVKKAKKAAKEKEIVSLGKRKHIDTTDDKSIDVYADEETAETTGETEE